MIGELLDDILGSALWPVVILAVVGIICGTIYEINHNNHENDVRKACVQQHGVLGEHNGWPTCTYPTPAVTP